MSNQPEQRTAVNDGNAGYVSAPSVRHTGVQNNTKRNMPEDGNTQLIQNVSSRLGSAFTKYIKEDNAHLEEQQRLAGVAKAGMKRSMDEVDVDVKQTKFTDFLFGEDVEYRAAQQQVITNGVEAKYREELAQIDQYKGFTEREYGEVLKESLNQLADQYKDDPETKQLATNAWITGAGKLVNKQHKEHFAYKQEEMTRIERETTKGRIDQMVIEEQFVSSPEDVKDYQNAWRRMFDFGNAPKGMTRQVKRNQMHEIVQEQLTSGNITAYKQALLHGMYDDASPDELAKLDVAIGKNDTKFSYSVNTTLEETVAAMHGVTDVEDAEAMVYELAQNIDLHETRQSGSEKSKSIIAEARSRMMKMLPDLMKKGAAAKRKADNQSEIRNILKKEKGYPLGVALSPYKDTEIGESYDANMIEYVNNFTGKELNGQEAAIELVENSNLSRAFVDNFREGHEVIPLVKDGMVAMLDGVEAMADPETGATNDQWGKVMTFMSGLDEANSERLAKTLGANYGKFQFYQSQTRARIPAKEMRVNYDIMKKNLDDKGAYAGTLDKPSDQSRRDFILEKVDMPYINTSAGTVVIRNFEEGLARHNGDVQLATKYAKTVFAADAMVVGNGVMVQNTGRINAQLEGYNLQQILGYADSTPAIGRDLVRGLVGDTLVQPKKRGWIADLFGDDREATVPTKLEQVVGLEIEVAADGDGLIMSAANGRVRRVPMDLLKGLVKQKQEADKVQKRFDDRKALMQARKVAENLEAKQLRGSRNLIDQIKPTEQTQPTYFGVKR